MSSVQDHPSAKMKREVPRVSVVCPFYNEEAILESSVKHIIEILGRQLDSWELVLVNDGSVDNSLLRLVATLNELGDDRVQAVSYEPNQGRGFALKTGIDRARGAIIVTTEIDLSWGDDIVQRLLSELEANPDVQYIVASPHLPGGGLDAVPFKRRMLTLLGNRLIGLFFASGHTMHTGMTRAYRREVIQPLIVRAKGKEFHLEVLLKLVLLGCSGQEIPATISWRSRHRRHDDRPRKSSTRIRETIASHLVFLAVAQPTRYFGAMAALVVVVGLGLVGAAVWRLMIGEVAIFLALTGMLAMLIGFLFVGFSVMFSQLNELACERWLGYYPGNVSPAAPRSAVVYPAET